MLTTSKLEAKADKMDAKKAGSGNNKRAAAANLRSDAAALRDTSSSAPTANIYSEADYANFGRRDGSQAFTTKDRRTINFSRGPLGVFGHEGLGMKWTIAHEGFHTFYVGLDDQYGTDGKTTAYKGTEAGREALRSIRGTVTATINPDSLLNGDN